MTQNVDKNLIDKLSELSKIDLEEEDDFLEDFEEIVDYFEKLQEAGTDGIEPLSGGARVENVFRSDDSSEKSLSTESARESFPEEQNGYLKIPPVFKD